MRPRSVTGLAALCIVFVAVPNANADVQYSYDAAGRLVKVVAPNGDVGQYQYDGVGNIVGVQRVAAGALAISQFSPMAGSIGTTVTISGSGFSTIAAQNTVQFNGLAATVVSASANQLTVTVPDGATTGVITVTTAAGTVSSADAFTVLDAMAAPTISGFNPTIGTPDTSVTISGTGFDTPAWNNRVEFNGPKFGRSITSSNTEVQTAVPTNATSGPITLKTRYGSATSSGDFYVVPNGYSTADVAMVGRFAINGPAQAININAPQKLALYIFNGTAGQNIGLGVANLSISPGGYPVMLTVKKPDGSILVSCQLTSSGVCTPPPLPVTGTYTVSVAISNSVNSASLSLSASTDVTGSLTVNGPSATYNVTRVGQSASYTFSGTAGQMVKLNYNNQTNAAADFYVYSPDGTLLWNTGAYSSASGYAPVYALPVNGTYTLRVTPETGSGTGSVTVSLMQDLTGTLALDGGAMAVSLQAGQAANYTFSGTVGQRIGLGAAGLMISPGGYSVTLTVKKPDGSTLVNCQLTSSGVCIPPPLPVAGTYTVSITLASGANSASLNLTASTDVTGGALTVNGPSATYNVTRVGQAASYTFSGTAGQMVKLNFYNPTNGLTDFYVYNPDGTLLWNTNVSPYAGGYQPVVFALPVNGTYTLRVTPETGSGTGSVTVGLMQDLTGTLALDGSAMAVSLQTGQAANYTFSGTAGQKIGLGVANLTTSVTLTVKKPDGSTLVNCALTSSGICILPPLPVAGTYTVSITLGYNTNSASLNLTASTDVTGSLTVNGPSATYNVTRVGQAASYTFSGTAGQTVRLNFYNQTNWLTDFYVYNPDGTLLWNTNVSPYASSYTFVYGLPVDGTYTLRITPETNSGTGGVTVSLQ